MSIPEFDTWARCVDWLEGELSGQDVSTWIRPLSVKRLPDRLL